MLMPPLETERLIVRPFTMDDFDAIHQILADWSGSDEPPQAHDERMEWMKWTIAGYEQNATLKNPPYGDRAVVLKENDQLIGSCGFVPLLAPFGQLPFFKNLIGPAALHKFLPEVGLFYALSGAHWGNGYATEATRAMIDYAFRELQLRRIVATTTYDNVRSIGVMERVGMTIEKNPYADPHWFEVVGILEYRDSES